MIARAPKTRTLPLLALLLALASAATAQIPVEPLVETILLDDASDVTLADLDEDGVLDALTTPQISFFGSLVRYNLLKGLGDGSFGAPVQGPILPTTMTGRGEVVDIDADSHLDWLLPDAAAPGHLLVYRGDGSLGFPAPEVLGSNASTLGSSVAIVRDLIGGDAHPDILLFQHSPVFGPPSGFSVLVADGLGGFSQVPGPTLTGGPHDVAVGDLDGDGLQDVVVTNAVVGQTIQVYMGTSPTSWMLGVEFSAAGGYPGQTELADGNGDGDLDMFMVNGFGGLMFIPGNGDGTFGAVQHSLLSETSQTLAVGDLDGDGALDAVVSTNAALNIFKGAGDGSFALVNTVLATLPAGIDLADVDGDGDLDIAAALNVGVLFGPDHLGVLINRSYGPGSPFTDLGTALAGSAGLPIQLAEGTLLPGTPFAFDLHGAVPDGVAFVIIGVSELNAPFKGGVLVPSPDIVRARPTDSAGNAGVAGIWNATGASGATAFVQWWFSDAGAFLGSAGSNAIRVDVP